MGFLFNRPAPQQAVPSDLAGGRNDIIRAIFGATPNAGQTRLGRRYGVGQYGQAQQGGGPAGQTQNVLESLLGLTSNPGANLEPLGAQFRQNMDYALSQINGSTPGRFSTANSYIQGQASQRALNDYNVLAANLLEQGRNRQLSAIMGLLGPVLGPMFGGPFTQNASPWENILGGAQTIAQFIPGIGGIPGLGGGGSNPGYDVGPWGAG